MKSNLLKKSFISLVGKIKKINYKKYYLDNNLDKILKVKQFKKIEFRMFLRGFLINFDVDSYVHTWESGSRLASSYSLRLWGTSQNSSSTCNDF